MEDGMKKIVEKRRKKVRKGESREMSRETVINRWVDKFINTNNR